jgi:hypothetical protein
MLKVYLSVGVGCAAAVWIFRSLISAKPGVTLRTWKGIFILYLVAMGTIRTVEIVLALVLGW